MRAFESEKTDVAEVDRSIYDIRDGSNAAFAVSSGLTSEIVEKISEEKHDPEWMRIFRLKALETYNKMPVQNWGPSIAGLDMNNIVTYVRPNTEMRGKWSDVPEDIKNTFERLGIPKAERASLAGVGAQYDSEVVYHNVKAEVAAGVHVEIPLQSYFRLNAPGAGQFEHTLIIVDKGAYLHFIEGCSAPKYNVANLHAGCVEIYVGENARVRYSTIENWSKNMYNLNTKRARVEITGITFAGAGQDLDTGAKVVHAAPNTSSHITTKSIARDGGISNFRSSVTVLPNAKNSKSAVSCESLMLDDRSRSDTIPEMDIRCDAVDVGHEAKIGRISEEAVFYLMSRGLSEEDARALIVGGFAEPIAKELPVEYAVEMNNLIHLEMKGSIG